MAPTAPLGHDAIIDKLRKSWTANGRSLALLYESSVKNGQVDEKAWPQVKDFQQRMQAMWNLFLIEDVLVVSMLLPLLFAELEPKDGMDEGTAEVLATIHAVCLSVSFFVTLLHLSITATMYGANIYLVRARDVLDFFVQIRREQAFLNYSHFSLAPFLFAAASTGFALTHGWQVSLFNAVFAAACFLVALVMMIKVLWLVITGLKKQLEAQGSHSTQA